jgi:hypothetical protein
MTVNNDFGIICVDNFYNDPDSVVEYALSCDYTITDKHFPGARTEPLFNINYDFYQNIFCKKLMSILFDLDNTYVNFSIDTRFHKIKKISNDPSVNLGGVHLDGGLFGQKLAFAGVIYLNKNYNLNCGTSIFIKKTDTLPEFNTLDEKWHNYANDDKQQYRNNFIETIRFQNIYNRLILYDSCHMHAINTLASDEDRLTQVFFCDSIISGTFPPGLRAKQYEYYK